MSDETHPLDLIDRFGADALRFTICALTGPGRDVKLGASRVQDYLSFVTKLWNAARFCEMHGIRPDASFAPAQATLPLTRWILDAANRTIEEADIASREAIEAARIVQEKTVAAASIAACASDLRRHNLARNTATRATTSGRKVCVSVQCS